MSFGVHGDLGSSDQPVTITINPAAPLSVVIDKIVAEVPAAATSIIRVTANSVDLFEARPMAGGTFDFGLKTDATDQTVTVVLDSLDGTVAFKSLNVLYHFE